MPSALCILVNVFALTLGACATRRTNAPLREAPVGSPHRLGMGAAEQGESKALSTAASVPSCTDDNAAVDAWIVERLPHGAETEATPWEEDVRVRERSRSGSTCTDTFRALRLDGQKCQRRVASVSVLTRDCCNRQCSADPVAWMLRLEEALARRDSAAIAAMLPPDAAVVITSDRGGAAGDGGSWTITRANVVLEALEAVLGGGPPQCPPYEDLLDENDSARSEPTRIVCGTGMASCGSRFEWSGDADQLYLREAVFRCC